MNVIGCCFGAIFSLLDFAPGLCSAPREFQDPLGTHLSRQRSGATSAVLLGAEAKAFSSISPMTNSAITALTGDPIAQPRPVTRMFHGGGSAYERLWHEILSAAGALT